MNMHIRGIVNGVVTFYPGRHYNREVDGAAVTVKKFYTLGSTTVAVRTVQGSNDTLNWILGDHLGSASVTANVDGSLNSELRYTAFGEVRYNNGLTPTDYRYTGQLEQAELGLYYYVARWYDPYLNHFTQADTLVPNAGDPASYDRYSYTLNNPIRYSDPSGHAADAGGGAATMGEEYWKKRQEAKVRPPLVPTPALPFNPSRIYIGPFGPTATPQTVLKAGPTRTSTSTATSTPLPPGEIAVQMGEGVADIFSPLRADPGSPTGTDVSSIILSGAQSISMSSPQLSWVYPVAETVVIIGTAFGAIWDIAPAVENWWSDANTSMRATAEMLQINGPTTSPTTLHAISTPVPIPSTTHTPTCPPPHW